MIKRQQNPALQSFILVPHIKDITASLKFKVTLKMKADLFIIIWVF
jgi:hypothetical protein